MADVDLQFAKDRIKELYQQINDEEESAHLYCKQMQAVHEWNVADRLCREKWRETSIRTYDLKREVENITKHVANVLAAQAPPPIFMVQKS